MTKRKVLICGASGFLGFNIFKQLSPRQDLDLTGTFLTNRYRRINPNDSRLIQADLTKQENVEQILSRKFDVVIQAAANSSGAKDVINNPQLHVTPNVAMNNWIISSAHEHNVKQFIFPSCTVMYPSSDNPHKEDDLDMNDIGSPRYLGGAWMKIYAEMQCKFFASLGRTKFTVIRHSNMYGPFDRFDPERSHVFGATIRKVIESNDGKVIVWGKGQEVRDFLHVSDFCNFIELIIDKYDYSFDLFNLGSGEAITIDDLIKKAIQFSGKNLEIEYDPSGPTIGTKISIDSTKARDKLGWKPEISIDEGIKRTIAWYKDNYNRQ